LEVSFIEQSLNTQIFKVFFAVKAVVIKINLLSLNLLFLRHLSALWPREY